MDGIMPLCSNLATFNLVLRMQWCFYVSTTGNSASSTDVTTEAELHVFAYQNFYVRILANSLER